MFKGDTCCNAMRWRVEVMLPTRQTLGWGSECLSCFIPLIMCTMLFHLIMCTLCLPVGNGPYPTVYHSNTRPVTLQLCVVHMTFGNTPEKQKSLASAVVRKFDSYYEYKNHWWWTKSIFCAIFLILYKFAIRRCMGCSALDELCLQDSSLK